MTSADWRSGRLTPKAAGRIALPLGFGGEPLRPAPGQVWYQRSPCGRYALRVTRGLVELASRLPLGPEGVEP